MKLLEAEPVVAPEVAPDAQRHAPQEQPPSPPEAGRTCSSCGAPMNDDQGWCLNCGTAAAGSLGQRPGWRAASTVIALTVLLVLGAIGASYAALSKDKKPAPTAAPAQQAQVAPPAATPPAATTPETTQSTPSTSSGESKGTLPEVSPSDSGSSSGSPLTPSTGSGSSTPSAPSTPSTPSGTSTGTGTGTSTPSGTSTGTDTGTTTTPTATPIELAGDAGKLYDPYARANANGTPERAIDGDEATSWYLDPKIPEQIGVGYAVDLGKLQGIREIQLQTPTPGFRIEVYATDETELPPDILDTRWSHITNVSDVGAKDDGTEKIVLGAGSTKYRNLLLWFTQPPTDGSRLRLAELKLLG